MGSEQVQDLETRAREAILDHVFAPSQETLDKLEIIYEVVRFMPAYSGKRDYRGIRGELEYTLGIKRRTARRMPSADKHKRRSVTPRGVRP